MFFQKFEDLVCRLERIIDESGDEGSLTDTFITNEHDLLLLSR